MGAVAGRANPVVNEFGRAVDYETRMKHLSDHKHWSRLNGVGAVKFEIKALKSFIDSKGLRNKKYTVGK